MSSLYIDRKGTEIKLSGEALVCYENGERVGTIPLAPIERIYLKSDVTVQASLLALFFFPAEKIPPHSFWLNHTMMPPVV